MKIYKKIKDGNKRIVTIFGITIIKQIHNRAILERTQEILGGLITTYKSTNRTGDYSKKEIKVLGKSFIERVDENNSITYFCVGKECYKIDLIKDFKRLYSKFFDKKYDDIYILNANSGEIYLTLSYIIDTLIKKNKSECPLLVATKKYHIDLIKMICPDLPYVYIKNIKMKVVGTSFRFDNFRFFLLYDAAHFGQVEIDINTNELGKYHYFQSILKRFNLSDNDLSLRKISVTDCAEQSMLEKVKKTGLNLDKFVFLAPEAYSCVLYDEDFWVVLINQLQEKGYDVFVNLMKQDVKLARAKNFKTCKLTFTEVFALARRARKIVSLRSGFTEFLLQAGVPMDVLYTKFRQRFVYDEMDSYHVMSGFGLLQLPFVDESKIQEFNMFETSAKECLDRILVKLQ